MSYLKRTIYFLGLLVLVALPLSSQAAVEAWPAGEAVDISSNLESGYEPSGLVWYNNSLFTVWDNGYLTEMDAQGNILHSTTYLGGDLEGLAIKDGYLYILNEYPQEVIEFNLDTWTKTGRTWLLSGMIGNSSSGAEAITYNSNKNLWYVGSQYDGDIYTYDNDFNYTGKIDTGINSDCSGLFHDQENNITYAIFDSYNTVLEVETGQTYQLLGKDQEGIAIHDGLFYIAQDSGAIMRYGEYIDKQDITIIETSSSGVPYIVNFLDDNYDLTLISLDDLRDSGVPSGTEVVIMPGSADYLNYVSYTTISLDQNIINNLQDFVNQGGGFVGICGGSIVGASILETTYSGFDLSIDMADLAPVTAVAYVEWYEQYAGSENDIGILNFSDHVLAGDYASGTHEVDYYGGPYFKDDSQVDVIATYTQDFLADKAAIVAKDKVVLSSVHPEYKTSTRFLLQNMVSYALGELEQPAPVDEDGDGYIVDEDCDDNNAGIYENQIYYADTDSDGLGDPASYIEVCSLTIPEGYVDNNSDEPGEPAPEPAPVDEDGDGYIVDEDCDDNNASVYTEIIYYYDYDQDGLGNPYSSLAVCSLDIPENYTDNASDLNDFDYDNDSVNTDTDCNDADSTIWDLQKYYADTDSDGLGDPENYLEVCSLTIPEGYVANYSDEPGEPEDEEPESPDEGLIASVNGKYININGEVTKIFKHKPLKTRYSVSEDETQIIVIGLFKKRATIVTLELDSDYQIISQEKNIIRYSQVIKKLKIKLKYLKQLYF